MITEVLRVGVDDGAADTKIVVYGAKGIITQVSIPSRARSGAHGTSLLGDFGAHTHVCNGYETEGTRFTVGDFSDSETARFDDYPFSGMNRVIVTHALRVANLGGRTLDIATGLPLSVYYRGDTPNVKTIDAKIESLAKKVISLDGTPTFSIRKSQVFPEGLAAFIDYAVDDDGNLRVDLNSETVGIIDIGGRTTDIAVVVPGGAVDHSRSGSENIGVLDLAEAVESELSKVLNTKIPASAIDKAIRTGKIRVWGEEKDVADTIEACAKNVLERIMREVNRNLGSAVDIDKILLVGGGARVFGRVAQQYKHIVIPENPEFANARGFAKYLNLQA